MALVQKNSIQIASAWQAFQRRYGSESGLTQHPLLLHFLERQMTPRDAVAPPRLGLSINKCMGAGSRAWDERPRPNSQELWLWSASVACSM